MSIQEVSAEELAKLFHHYEEALFEDFHGLPKENASPSWEQVPQNERDLKVAAARLTLLELGTPAEAGRSPVFRQARRGKLGLLGFPAGSHAVSLYHSRREVRPALRGPLKLLDHTARHNTLDLIRSKR